MSRATLLALLIEVLELISGHLDSRGLSRLSKSCKTLRAATCSSLFRNISICFVDIERLAGDVGQWVEILDCNAAWKAVKRLELHAEFVTPPLLGIPDLGDDPLEPWQYFADDTAPHTMDTRA